MAYELLFVLVFEVVDVAFLELGPLYLSSLPSLDELLARPKVSIPCVDTFFLHASGPILHYENSETIVP